MLTDIISPYIKLNDADSSQTHQTFYQILKKLKQHLILRQQKFYDSADTAVMAVSNNYLWLGKFNGNISGVNLQTNHLEVELTGHKGTVNVLVMLSDDKSLISGGADGTIRIWDILLHTQLEITHYEVEITGIVKHISENFIAYSTGDYKVYVWDLEKKELFNEYYGHDSKEIGMGFINQEGKELLMSGDQDGHAKIWDLYSEDSSPVALVEFDTKLNSMTVSWDGQTVVAGGENSLLYIWQVQNPDTSIKLTGHTQPITQIIITSDNEFCISTSEDRTIKVWSLKELRFICDLKKYNYDIINLALSPRDIHLYSLSFLQHSRSIKRFQLAEDLNNEDILTIQYQIPSFCLTETSDIIYTDRNSVILYDKITKADLSKKTFEVNISCMITSPDGKYLIVAEDASIKIFNLQSDDTLKCKSLVEHQDVVNLLVCSNDSSYLLSSSKDNMAILWDLNTHDLIKHITLPHKPVDPISLSNSSAVISSFSYNPLSSKKSSIPGISSLSISASNTHILLALDDGNLKIFSTDPTNQDSITFPAHTQRIVSIHVIPDNSTFITIGLEGTMKFWDMYEFVMIAEFRNKQLISPTCSILTKDGEYVCIGAGNEISIWSVKDQCYLGSLQICNSVSQILIDSSQINLYISSGNSIFKIRNFLDLTNSMFIHGPSKYSFRLIQLVRATLKPNKDTKTLYEKSLNDWVIYPWRLSILHIFSYYDDTQMIKACLEDKCRFFNARVPDDTDECKVNPISITFERKNRGALELLTNAIGDMADEDPYVFIRIENNLTSLNYLAPKSLPYLYKQAFLTAKNPKLPKFGVLKQRKSSVSKTSSSPEINVDNFINKAFTGGIYYQKDEAIVFKCSGFRLVSSTGSNGSIELLKSLTSCENSDVFRTPLIHAFLMYKWDRVKWFITIQTILHLTIMLLLCIDAAMLRENTLVMINIFLVNVVIFLWEIFQMSSAGPVSYLKEIWNLFDITRILLIFAYVISSWCLDYKVWLNIVLALAMFLTMVRTASFFRLFRRTRYLIRMIQEIIWDMWPFLIIYFYSIFAFAWLYLVLSELSEPETYTNSWLKVYMINFGQFDTDNYTVLQWISLILTTTVNPLLMMNLLIAVMGDTYDRVQQDIVVADLKEIANQILDIESVMFWRRNVGKPRYFQMGVYTEGISDSITMDDVWEGRIRQILNNISGVADLVKQHIKPVNEELLLRQILSIKEDLTIHMKTLNDRQKAFENRVDYFLRNELANSAVFNSPSLHHSASLQKSGIKTYTL